MIVHRAENRNKLKLLVNYYSEKQFLQGTIKSNCTMLLIVDLVKIFSPGVMRSGHKTLTGPQKSQNRLPRDVILGEREFISPLRFFRGF